MEVTVILNLLCAIREFIYILKTNVMSWYLALGP